MLNAFVVPDPIGNPDICLFSRFPFSREWQQELSTRSASMALLPTVKVVLIICFREPSRLGFLELFDDYVVTVITTYEELSRQARLLQLIVKTEWCRWFFGYFLVHTKSNVKCVRRRRINGIGSQPSLGWLGMSGSPRSRGWQLLFFWFGDSFWNRFSGFCFGRSRRLVTCSLQDNVTVATITDGIAG